MGRAEFLFLPHRLFLHRRMVNMTSVHFIYRDIDKVDELMQDIADQQELAEEISTAISKPVGFGEEFDEVSVFMQITQASQMTPAAL